MSETPRAPRHEKPEKEEEKRREKQEKSWEEKWQRDPVNVAAWAAAFIWAGLVLLGSATNFSSNFSWWSTWGLIFAGAGAIIIIGAIIRLLMPVYRRPVTGSLIVGFIFLGIGLGGLVGWGVVWAFVLIAIGVIIVAFGLRHRRR